MESRNPPSQDLLLSLSEDLRVVKERVVLSPTSVTRSSSDDPQRDDHALLRLALESEHAKLIRFRDRNFLLAHIALYIGLASILAGVVLVATLTRDIQTGLGLGATSATVSGVMFYLRSTFMKTVDKTLDHIQRIYDLHARRANQDEYWKAVQLVLKSGDPRAASILKALRPAKNDGV